MTTPNDWNAIQWALDADENPAPYASELVDGLPVLNPLNNAGDLRPPRGKRCYLFDATDDFVKLPDNPVGLWAEITIAVWIKMNASGNYPMIISHEAAGWEFRTIGAQRRLELGGSGSQVTAATAMDLNTWYQGTVSYRKSDGQTDIYLNGAPDGSGTITATHENEMHFGARGAVLVWPGWIRDVQMWNRVLTPAEVLDLYNGGSDAGAPTRRYYLNEEGGTVCFESAGTGQHGRISNASLATFHAVDDGVTENRANEVGYTANESVVLVDDDFSTGIAGWEDYSAGSGAHVDGKLEVTGGTGNNEGVLKRFTAEVGREYAISFDIERITAVVVDCGVGDLDANTSQWYLYVNSDGPKSGTFIATATDLTVKFFPRGDGSQLKTFVDNVSIRGVDAVVPRDESNTANDVYGDPLQFSGVNPYPMVVESPAGKFDGVDDHIDFGGISAAPTAFSAFFQINGDRFDSFNTFLATDANSFSLGIWLYSNSGGNQELAIRVANNITISTLGMQDALFADRWISLGFVFDGAGNVTFYREDDSETLAYTGSLSAAATSRLGRVGANYPLTGMMGRVSLWEGVRTAQDFSDWRRGVLNTDSLTHHYSFAEGGGTTLYNAVANANHGTITNASLPTFWAERTDAIREHGIEYGGRDNAGVFVPGLLDGSNAADGQPLAFPAGHFSNPGSRLIYNRWGAPQLDPILLPAESTVGQLQRQDAPQNTKFRSEEGPNDENTDGTPFADGDNRIFNVLAGLTGSDLDDAIKYIGRKPPFLASWARHSNQLIQPVAVIR